jgi:hypothetical protein
MQKFQKMKLHNIYIKKDSFDQIKDIKTVKEGFSFYAFFFAIFWFLYHKMWKYAAIIFIIYLSFSFLGKSFGQNIQFAFELSFALLVGFNANYIRQKHLSEIGYEFLGSAFGKNELEAQLNYIKENNL